MSSSAPRTDEIPAAKPETDATTESPTDAPTAKELDAAPVNEGWRWYLRLMVALLFPVLLETLDYTVVATAQPFIASEFNALNLQSYIGTTYVLSSTVFLPLFASFSDLFGRHAALQLALIFFMAGSALSTGAQNMAMMLSGRAIAGIGAAGMITLIRIIMADARSLQAQSWQVSMIFLLYGIGYSIGPVVGGYLYSVSFRLVFGINLPICLVSAFLIFFLLRKRLVKHNHFLPLRAFQRVEVGSQSIGEKLARFDFVGAVLFIVAGTLLLLGLNWGSTEGWKQAKVIACLVVSGLLLAAFACWEYLLSRYELRDWPPIWARADPMIPLEIFMNRNILIVQWALFSTGMVILVAFYFLSVFYILVAGLDSKSSGVALLYFAPGMGVGALISIRLIKHLKQPRIPALLGQVVLCVGIGLLSWAMDNNNQTHVKIFLALMGAGVGLSIGPLSVQARYSLPPRFIAVVVAVNLFFQTLGGMVGIAQCAAVLNARVRHDLTELIKNSPLPPEATAELGRQAASAINSLDGINSLPPEIQAAIRHAFGQATRWAFISLIPWTAISSILVLFLTKVDTLFRPPEDTPAASASAKTPETAAASAEKVATTKPETV